MKKESYRDYATAAFRFYAVCRGEGTKPDNAVARLDYDAVVLCLCAWMQREPDKYHAVQTVYMTEPDKPIGRGDIVARVRRCADELHMDDSGVYRLLKEARREFAEIRGLRVESCE